MSLASQLAPPDVWWQRWAWLGTADLRVLWAILGAAVLLFLCGALVGWRSR